VSLIILFWACLVLACGHAFIRGGRPERLVAWTILLGTIASLLALPPIPERQGQFFWRVALVDIVVLLLFVRTALRYDRFWPMAASGFQLAGVATELTILVDHHLVSGALEDLLAFWTYPILLALLLGSISYRRRILRQTHTL
jgi:hypothetical protein